MEYYKVLGLEKQASLDQIKMAYRTLSKRYHPDMTQNDPAKTELFLKINQAYNVLKDERARARYDGLSDRYSKEDSVFYQQQATNTKYYAPEIRSFRIDPGYFFQGDVLKVTWECLHVDTIEIRPFGYVQSLSGTMNYRINKFRKRYLPIEIKATNSKTGAYVSQRLIIENGIFKTFTAQEQQESQGVFSSPEALSLKGLFIPTGRLSVKEYRKRTLALLVLSLVLYGVSFVFFVPGVWSLLVMLFCFIFLTQSSRRFQDLGISGLFCFVMLIPYLNILVYLGLVFQKGKNRVNKYGRPFFD